MKEDFLDRVRRIVEEKSLDGVLITKRENVRYLTNFSGTTGYVFCDGDDAIFLTDFRYIEQAEKECISWKVDLLKEGIRNWLKDKNIKRIGLEDSVTLGFVNLLKEEGIEATSIGRLVEEMRVIKDKREIELIEESLRIAERAFLETLPFIKEGVREKDVEAELVYRMKKNGADKEAFDVIVASGNRSSLPHGTASTKRIAKNEVIVIDFGAVYKGYHSDITRVVFIGKPDEEVLRIHRAIVEAMDEVISGIREGVDCRKLHGVTIDVLSRYGYERYFGHGTGHGVGLEIHEAPTISHSSQDRITRGMVFTVEPGVYIQGGFGLRVEDMVYFDGEPVILTKLDRNIYLI